METVGKITLFFFGIVLAFLVALLGTKVVMSVSNLYSLEFITKFSFIQLYGIMCVKSIIFYRYRKEDEKEEGQSAIEKMFISIFTGATFYLVSWGLSFLAYYILN